MTLAINDGVIDYSSHWMGENIGSHPFHSSECRICHDEDENSNMETPCSCRGSLNYAHRKCIQRWCNEKGDTTCEICQEEFKPGYTAPPPSFHSGEIPFQLRESWELFTTDLQTPHFMEMVANDHDFMESDFYDCPVPHSRSLMCCRAVAIIFVVLLLLRYTLTIIVSEVGEYPMTFLMLMMLRAIWILLLVYILTRTLAAILRCQRQQV